MGRSLATHVTRAVAAQRLPAGCPPVDSGSAYARAMGGAVDASVRGRAVIGLVLAVALTLMLPALVTSDAIMPAMAAVALALAASLLVRPRTLSIAASTYRAAPPSGGWPPPVLPGRVTDPVHHPLRPRAPGQV
jgi:hypothetical protein